MKENTNLANIQVCLTFRMQDMQREVLPPVGNWFLTLSQKVKLQKNFGAEELISKLDINRYSAQSKENA